jgi:hypothetical protein
MSAPSIPLPQTVDDASLLARWMPNRAFARIYKGAAIFCVMIGVLAGIQPASNLFSEFQARRNWSAADGNILTVEQHSRYEHAAGQGTLSSWTVYWNEAQVEFAAPSGCNTGTTWSPVLAKPLSCIATLSSPQTKSWAEAQSWRQSHPLNTRVQVLYDPKGPGVRFADESVWDGSRWDKLFLSLGILAFGLAIFGASQRRLGYLAYLPEGQDLPAPQHKQGARLDELVDLKL